MGCMITNGGAGGGVCCNPSRPRGARRLARLARLACLARLARLASGTLPWPCRAVSHGQPRLACHCHFTARRPASSRYQRSRSATPTIPPSHDTAAPCHDTINHAPADAPSMQGPFRLEPRTPPACRNALLPSFHLALRLLPSGPRCFWRRLRLYHAQRSHTLPPRFAHGPTVSHPNSSLSWSPSPSLLPAACCRSFLPRQRLGTPTARLPWPPSSPGQVARTTLRGRHLNLPR
jgi:hypothetical protein